MRLRLYLITRTDRIDYYDEYDSIVVAAKSIASARKMNPGGDCWPSNQLKFRYLGIPSKEITKECILHTSFNAG